MYLNNKNRCDYSSIFINYHLRLLKNHAPSAVTPATATNGAAAGQATVITIASIGSVIVLICIYIFF